MQVWSAPNYCYRCGNVASILSFNENMVRGTTYLDFYICAQKLDCLIFLIFISGPFREPLFFPLNSGYWYNSMCVTNWNDFRTQLLTSSNSDLVMCPDCFSWLSLVLGERSEVFHGDRGEQPDARTKNRSTLFSLSEFVWFEEAVYHSVLTTTMTASEWDEEIFAWRNECPAVG